MASEWALRMKVNIGLKFDVRIKYFYFQWIIKTIPRVLETNIVTSFFEMDEICV